MWRFLHSEMLVILGMTEDAYRTDSEIADLYGLNKGTVASVRRRMLDAGAIYYANVPAFNKLGCEMIGFHTGTTDPGVASDLKAGHYLDFCESAPQMFFSMIGGGNVAFYTAFCDATELEGFIQKHNSFFTGQRRSSKAKLDTVMFPYRMSRGTYTTNFAPTVHRFFQLEVPQPKSQVTKRHDVTSPDLSDTAKRTLIAMVENPNASDREMAEKVKLSRQAVTRIRNKLVDEGYVTKVCVPRLYKWGFEIYAVTHSRFSMEVAWESRLKAQPKEPIDLSFLTLSKADESVTNHMISRYQEYAENLEDILAWYHKSRIFDESPRINVFSLERCTELRVFDFAPVVKNLLGTKQKR
ncbi:MAG: winged helix-turn-helix domain-containing protein [Candidatus Thermoplasmatota archaeon]|nr:winged helix-turn-helix domain-containing protein [Candidatus Thermoplasmatota archaeon]